LNITPQGVQRPGTFHRHFSPAVLLPIREADRARDRAGQPEAAGAEFRLPGHHADPRRPGMTDDAAGFGARLGDFPRSAGLSQQALAERSGLSIRAISNLERGRTWSLSTVWPTRWGCATRRERSSSPLLRGTGRPHVNLRGYGPDEPVPAADALERGGWD
jgi:hypothetical protein